MLEKKQRPAHREQAFVFATTLDRTQAMQRFTKGRILDLEENPFDDEP
jgi:hypothetical protein